MRAVTGKTTRVFIILLLLLGSLQACTARPAVIQRPDGGELVVDSKVLQGLADFNEEVAAGKGVPLDLLLYTAGYDAAERVIVSDSQGALREFDWPTVSGQAWWLSNGRLLIGDETLAVSYVQAMPPELGSRVQARIIDIAPTAAQALGLPMPRQAGGRALSAPPVQRAVIIILDGLGYMRYSEARAEGHVPHLATLGDPLLGVTVYPPVTNVATAALLTGARPAENGVEQRGVRKTSAETILNAATTAGRRVVAVEGAALAFNLPDAELVLSGDRDQNGSGDDNVLSNTLAALQAGPPDLLLVHFHGIDDSGHTYGPGSPEETAKVEEVDGEVGRLLEAIPGGTLVIIAADHGMHVVQEGDRLGNHGQLVARDMFVPIWLLTR